MAHSLIPQTGETRDQTGSFDLAGEWLIHYTTAASLILFDNLKQGMYFLPGKVVSHQKSVSAIS